MPLAFPAEFPVKTLPSTVKVGLPLFPPRNSAPPAPPVPAAELRVKVEFVTVRVDPLTVVYRIAPPACPELLFENVVLVMVTLPAGLQLMPAALKKPVVQLPEMTEFVKLSESPVPPPRIAPPPKA